MKKIILISVLVLGTLVKVAAQQIPLYSQYYINPYLYNPAMAGYGNANIFLIDREQWTGIEGAPTTRAFTLDGPINANKVGLGLTATDDQTSIFDRLNIYGSYAYNIHFAERSDLRLGLSAGLLDNRIDYTKVTVKDPGDKAILTQYEDKSTFDGTFGAAYIYKDLAINFAVPQLLAPRLNYMQGSNLEVYYSLVRNVIGSVNYAIHFSDDKWKVTPLVFAQYAGGTPLVLDIGANVKYKDLAWLGLMWRKDFSVSASAGVMINKRIGIGYAYDMMTTSIATYAGTTQELSVRYIFGKGSNNDEELQDRLRKINDKVEMDNKQHRVTEDSLKNEIKVLQRKTDSTDNILNHQQRNFDDFKKDMLDSLGRVRSNIRQSGSMAQPQSPAYVAPATAGHSNNANNGSADIPSYELNNIKFGTDNATLAKSSYGQLNELAATLKKNPTLKIELDGFCDVRGSDEFNQTLSEKRADAVRKYLIKHGVKKGQVETKGFGRTMPIADNNTPEGMQKNRRVEFKVLEK